MGCLKVADVIGGFQYSSVEWATSQGKSTLYLSRQALVFLSSIIVFAPFSKYLHIQNSTVLRSREYRSRAKVNFTAADITDK